MHDHGIATSPDAFSPVADTCPFTLEELPCGCQDVHYACGYVDREHDHVICPGPERVPDREVGRGKPFREWAAEQEAAETPAQAELRRRFAEAFRQELDQEERW